MLRRSNLTIVVLPLRRSEEFSQWATIYPSQKNLRGARTVRSPHGFGPACLMCAKIAMSKSTIVPAASGSTGKTENLGCRFSIVYCVAPTKNCINATPHQVLDFMAGNGARIYCAGSPLHSSGTYALSRPMQEALTAVSSAGKPAKHFTSDGDRAQQHCAQLCSARYAIRNT